jgi:hypothetical protein
MSLLLTIGQDKNVDELQAVCSEIERMRVKEMQRASKANVGTAMNFVVADTHS